MYHVFLFFLLVDWHCIGLFSNSLAAIAAVLLASVTISIPPMLLQMTNKKFNPIVLSVI